MFSGHKYKSADLELNNVSSDGGASVGLGLGPLEVGVVLVPVHQLNVARLAGFI